MARVVLARVGRHRDLAEAGRVADGAGALERGAAGARHDHVAGAAVLAFLTSGRARVLVLAVLADIVRRATANEKEAQQLENDFKSRWNKIALRKMNHFLRMLLCLSMGAVIEKSRTCNEWGFTQTVRKSRVRGRFINRPGHFQIISLVKNRDMC